MAIPIVSVVLARTFCQISDSQEFPDFELIATGPQVSTAAAWNDGISRSSGEYLAFVKPNDGWSLADLSRQLAKLCANLDLDWCYSSTVVDSPSGNVLRPLLINNFIPTDSVVVRRRGLDKAGRFDESESCRSSEEWDMWLRLAASNKAGVVSAQAAALSPKLEPGEQLFNSRKHVVELAVNRWPDLKDLRSEALAEICIRAGNSYLLVGKRTEARDKFAEALTHSPLRSDAYLSWVSSYLLTDSQQQMRDLHNLGRHLQPAKKGISVRQ